MPVDSRKDDLLGAIAVIVLLIGTATGNAYAMLGMSVVSLVLIAVFCRQKIGVVRFWSRLSRPSQPLQLGS